jgi:addiction module HigA family antidote
MLAKALEVPPNRITAILNGQRGITGDTAVRLATFFNTTGEFWMNLQKTYELRLAEQHFPARSGDISKDAG